MTLAKIWIFAGFAFAAVLGTAACSPGQEAAAPTAPAIIRVDGSSTVYPLARLAAAAFAQYAPDASAVEPAESGTGAGFDKFCRGETDITGASRPIQSAEILACFRGSVRYVEVPLGFDGVTVIVHPSNPVRAITLGQLRDIWAPEAQATAMTWRQANAAWPDQPLVLFGPGADSGTFDYFTEAIVGAAGQSRTDYTASEDDEIIVEGVANNPNAMGYLGHAYFERNQERLRALAIDAGGGRVAPTAETIAGGEYQPLARPIFFYVNVASLDRPEVSRFIEFYVNNAGRLATEVGYVPLPESAYATYLERIQGRRVGTAFSGRPAIGMTIEEVIAQPLIEPQA